MTISNIAANDPDGLGSYTIISSLFGTLASGTGILPSSILTGDPIGNFNKIETITITSNDL
jgi:hypothetical protein